MNNIQKALIAVPAVLAASAAAFYFWAKSSNMSADQHARVDKFSYQAKRTLADSVFSVATYNIGYVSGMTNNTSVKPSEAFFSGQLEQATSALAKLDVDILALQEIDFASNRSYMVNQYEHLASIGYPYGARAVNWDKRYVPFPYFPPSVHFGKMISGQALLSKFPIQLHERHVLEPVPGHPFYYKAMYLDRLAELATIQIGKHILVIINAHTEAFDAPTRVRQIDYLKKLYLQYANRYPTILLGDFNSDPSYKENGIEQLLQTPGMGSACPQDKLLTPSSLTYPTDTPKEQLDFIFFNKDRIECVEWSVYREIGQVSDHYPVMMKFKIKPS